MTFLGMVNALPENERASFFRAMFAMCEAGRKAGVPADALGALYSTVVTNVAANTQAPMIRVHKEAARVMVMLAEKIEAEAKLKKED